MNLFTLKNGKTVYCDKPTKEGAEAVMALFDETYSRFCNGQKMWAMDIGTSCGDSTIVMAANLAKGSRIVCFEPSREIYPLLRSNLERNPEITSACDIDIHTVAAGASYVMMDFDYHIDNGGLAIPGIVHPRTQPPYQVQVVNTYQYLMANYSIPELQQIKFIKIDTEGYDFAVIRGLLPLIKNNQPHIVCEWWNDPVNSLELFQSIDMTGYRAFNSRNEPVTANDFSTGKRTQDLFLLPPL